MSHNITKQLSKDQPWPSPGTLPSQVFRYVQVNVVQGAALQSWNLRYIKDWATRVHAMIDGRGQVIVEIDYSIVQFSLLLKYVVFM